MRTGASRRLAGRSQAAPATTCRGCRPCQRRRAPAPGAPEHRRPGDFDPLAYPRRTRPSCCGVAATAWPTSCSPRAPAGRGRQRRAGRTLEAADRPRGRAPRRQRADVPGADVPGVGRPARRRRRRRPGSAVGLAQILPGTAAGLLAMRVDLARGERIPSHGWHASAAWPPPSRSARRRRVARGRVRAARPAAEGRRALRPGEVDRRRGALPGVRGEASSAAPDLAAASYHMGVGNLQDVIAAYVRPRPLTGSTAQTVAEVRHLVRAALLRLVAGSQPRTPIGGSRRSATTRATTCSSSTPPTRSCACTPPAATCSTGSPSSRPQRRAPRTCCARPIATPRSRTRGICARPTTRTT